MSLLPPYAIGTASVTHGTTTVTIATGILTESNCRERDTFVDKTTGLSVLIESRTDTSHLELSIPWPGSSLVAAEYLIQKTSLLRGSFGGTDAAVQKLIDTLNGRTFYTVIGTDPTTDGLVAEEDQYALKTNSGSWQLWRWTSGAWVLQSQPVGVTYRGEWSGATAYVVNDRVSRDGVSYTCKQNNTNHDPELDTTFTYWDAAGVKDSFVSTADRSGTTGAATPGLIADIARVIAAGGGKLRLPPGMYDTTGTQIVVDLTGVMTRFQGRIIIEGDGVDSVIRNTTGSCFKFLGEVANPEAYFELRNLRITSSAKPSGSVGLTLVNAAWARIENVVIELFDLGVDATDVEQIGWQNCNIRFNTGGIRINVAASFTDPNSWTFLNCAIANNSVYGIQAVGLNALTYLGGSIQYNGTIGSGTGYGISMSETGYRGYGTALFAGMVFEGNGGEGDVVSSQTVSTSRCNVTFDTVSFVRTLNFVTVGYGVNQIKIAGNQPADYVLENCNFLGLSGYVANAARQAIVNTNTSARLNISGSTRFWSDTEATITREIYVGRPGQHDARIKMGSASGGEGTLIAPNTPSNFNWTLPAITGTLLTDGSTKTLTNTTFDSAGSGNAMKVGGTTVTGKTGTGGVLAMKTDTVFDGTTNVSGILTVTGNAFFNSGVIGGVNPSSVLTLASTTNGAPSGDAIHLVASSITLSQDPTIALGAATKQYVDQVAQGLDAKPSVVAATTANITLSGAQTVDGISLVAGDRCLVKNQTTSANNGIYTVASGAWTRATDADSWVELPGAFAWVERGTINGDTGWVCTVDQGGTLGSTSVTFTQFAGAGSYTAGNGLTLTGTQFSIDGTIVGRLATANTWAGAQIFSTTISVVGNAYFTGVVGGINANSVLTLASTSSGAPSGDRVDIVGSTIRFNSVPVREILGAARTYYVRTDGSDSNTGLVNSAGGAFLTIQKAVDTVCALDMSIYQATIQIADGTYTGAVALKNYLGALPPIIRGNNTTPANVVISTTSAHALTNDGGPKWRLLDLKVQTTTGGDCINVTNGGKLSFGNLNFGACAAYHMEILNGGLLQVESNYTITGGASAHYAALGGQIYVVGIAVTLSGTFSFSSAFATASRSGGNLEAYSSSFTGGTITGTRYSGNINGTIVTLGGANYFPGNAAGTTATGAQYI